MSQRPKDRVRISPGFFLLTAWFGVVNGWRLLAVVLGAAALHELGHCLALSCLGAGIGGLRIGVSGAVLEVEGRLSYGGELLATLAGPAANLAWAVVLTALDSQRWAMAVGAHLTLAVFNLLPIVPLDGGRALYLLTAWAAGPGAAERAVRWSGGITAVALAAGLVFLMKETGGSLWLLPAAVGLLISAGKRIFL